MKNAIGLLLVGAAVGIAVNALMSSDKKSGMRKKLFKGAEDFADNLKDKIHESHTKISQYAEMAEDRIDSLNRKIKALEKSMA